MAASDGSTNMNNLFMDIETTPVEVPQGADAEAIKKLSLSACTAHVLCPGFALGDAEVAVVAGEEELIPADFWVLAEEDKSLRQIRHSRLRPEISLAKVDDNAGEAHKGHGRLEEIYGYCNAT